PHAILDANGRIVGALAGRPRNSGWDDVLGNACEVLRNIRLVGDVANCFGPNDIDHRRGRFLAVPVGVSFGGGQKVKMNEVIASALASPGLVRIAGFQSQAFYSFAPKIFRDIQSGLLKLYENDPHLSHNFANSIYPTVSLNCGPGTTCLEHLDYGNAPYSFCAVTALGQYDPDLGGHLILFDLKKVFRFPPGSTILLLSATLSHGNTPISPNATRYSVTQYCPGGLLRWVAYGCKPVKSLGTSKQAQATRLKVDGEPGQRWREKLALFSTLASLKNDYKLCPEEGHNIP
ncbi:hypothetical protein BDN72DRAFT_774653, partial [Pluteus cervinus]